MKRLTRSFLPPTHRAALAAACLALTACGGMQAQQDSIPAGYIVSSYTHEGADEGSGKQVYAFNPAPVAYGVESGAVYLESINGSDYRMVPAPGFGVHSAMGYDPFNPATWNGYGSVYGNSLLARPGVLNNHLVILPPSRRPLSAGPTMSMPGTVSMPASSAASPQPRMPAARAMPRRTPQSNAAARRNHQQVR